MKEITMEIPARLSGVVDESLRQVGQLHRRKVAKRIGTTFGSFAVLVAAFLVFGFSNPALASEIPLIGQIFKNVSQKTGQIPANIEEYGLAQSVNQTAAGAEGCSLTATKAYSDGYTVVVGLELSAPEGYQEQYSYLESGDSASAVINGEEAEISTLSLFTLENGKWIAAADLEVPESQRGAETLDVSMTLGGFSGSGEKASAEESDDRGIDGPFALEFPVTVDREHETSFTSSAEDNGAKVLAVLSTPARTVITVEQPYWGYVHPSIPGDGSKGRPALYTADGTEIARNIDATWDGGWRYDSKETQTGDLYFDGIPAGETKVVLRFCADNSYKEAGKLAEFTIDLEKKTVTPAGTVIAATPEPNATQELLESLGFGEKQNGCQVAFVEVYYGHNSRHIDLNFVTDKGVVAEQLRVEVTDARGDLLLTSDSTESGGENQAAWMTMEEGPDMLSHYVSGDLLFLPDPTAGDLPLQGEEITTTIKDLATGEVLCTDTRTLE